MTAHDSWDPNDPNVLQLRLDKDTLAQLATRAELNNVLPKPSSSTYSKPGSNLPK